LARIATSGGGYKTVLIELQKAKLASDIMRFRRYLGIHYQNPANTYGKGDHRKARQIYCIFLLGYDIGVSGRPVIQVDSQTTDVATNEEVEILSNEFIESLHHRSWIVQIDQLKQRRRNDLEKLLSIFDQENRTKNHHILNVDEDDFPEEYRSIIRRLRMAAENEDIQIEMEMEDDYLEELRDKERKIAEKEKSLAEKKKIIREQKKINREQKKAMKEQGKAMKEQEKALKEQEKALKDKDKALKEQGKAIEELKKQLSEMQRK
jgi:hypothetical protein